jgi:hypothetical protein
MARRKNMGVPHRPLRWTAVIATALLLGAQPIERAPSALDMVVLHDIADRSWEACEVVCQVVLG